ncbi:MAG: IS1634 family transposase [Erysipelotrichia bacterium]|nr:IS1634 family transposase [Erysipelotrichia bacterium]
MFVKATKAKGYTYVNIVESYRDEAGVSRHKILYNFGRLDELKADKSFVNCIKKICRLIEIPLLEDREEALAAGECSEAEITNYGYLAYKKIWDILGIRSCLERTGETGRLQLDLEKTTLLMAIQHLLCPRSKLSAYEHQGIYYGFPDIPLQHMYRALDRLAENKEKIEQELFEINHLKAGQEADIVFYDVTTFAFQSIKTDELKDFGFSKDCRFGEVQVVMGLLLDADGMPIGYELFPGNTFDGKTMVSSLDNLKKKFNIRKVVIVADRGLNSRCNLNLIKEAGYGYIVACRLRSMNREVQGEALNEADYIKAGGDFKYKTVPYTNIFKDAEKNTHQLEESLVMSWSSKRAAKDVKDRQRLTHKAEKLLKTPASIEALSKRGGKKYLKDESGNQPKWVLDDDKIKNDSLLDGYYGIQTSETEMSAADVMNAYHMLWKIEESFRIMKSTMEVRPVFHRTPDRIRGHFLMCFLAFMMERKLESLLPESDEDDETNSPVKIREALNSMQLAKVTFNGDTVYFKTKNLPLGTKIFKSVSVKTPLNISREEQLAERFFIPESKFNGQMSFF